MPRKLSLLQQVQTPSNLRAAWSEINRSNPLSSGLSSFSIQDFSLNLKNNLANIRRQVKAGKYLFRPVKGVPIIKKGQFTKEGKPKKRGIRVAEVSDRVVQRAITRVIEPILIEEFQLNNGVSFAYLPRQGVRSALNQMVIHYREGNPVVFEADIEKFFDTVNRDKLLNEMVFPALPDQSINELITAALNQEIGNKDAIPEADRSLFPDGGIPQGGGLSPLFANVYLHNFDKRMLKESFKLIRYADDFIVMCKDKAEALRAHNIAQEEIEGRLGLTMHKLNAESKTRILKVTQDHFEFLGTRFNGRRLWPSDKKIQIFNARLREITEQGDSKTLLGVLSKLKAQLEGWVSAYCHTDVEPYMQTLEAELKEKLGIFTHSIDWNAKRQALSPAQLASSGIQPMVIALEFQRKKLNIEQRANFSGLWTQTPQAITKVGAPALVQ
ncbi:MAG: hypothetical protein JNN05_02290 [Candidatus Omnitrophica bacterium]|nr:hypothetical protein [Candidatus Omnitrophota bacterium]